MKPNQREAWWCGNHRCTFTRNRTNQVGLQFVGHCQAQQAAHNYVLTCMIWTKPSIESITKMPTVEDVTTCLSQEKKFTVIDAKNGFWQKRLDTEFTCSYKTTFNMPISSYIILEKDAIWHLFSTRSLATYNAWVFWRPGRSGHDQRQLPDCWIWQYWPWRKPESWKKWPRFSWDMLSLELEVELWEVKQHQLSVKFMGHLLTSQGLMPHPEKIQVILKIPKPEDVTALKKFLGMSCKVYAPPTREDRATLTSGGQECGVTVVRTALSYNEHDQEVPDRGTPPLLLWCKQASHSTMWGKPVWLRSKKYCYKKDSLSAMTPVHSESSYAQIEKKMLTITWAWDKFDHYLYGCDTVTIKTDHEPFIVKSVFKKEIHKSPKHLQQMCLALPKVQPWVVHTWKLLIRPRPSSVRFVHLRWWIMKNIFVLYLWNKTWRCGNPRTCDQVRQAQQEVPCCCSALLWQARRVDRVAGSSVPWRTTGSALLTLQGHVKPASQQPNWHQKMYSPCLGNTVLARNECWDQRLTLYNLPNMLNGTGLWRSSTARAALTPLAELLLICLSLDSRHSW